MRTMIYVIAATTVAVLIVMLLISDGLPSGAAVKEQASGTVCCEFENDGQTKTCAALEGQTCEVCDSICAARSP